MDNRKKDVDQKGQSKKKKEGLDDCNKTNTIHSQNEEIEKGNVETDDRKKNSKDK